MSQPHSTKTHNEDRIPGNGLLPDQGPGGGPLGVRSPTQKYNFCHLLTVKVWPRFKLLVKIYSISATDRQTTCSPIGRDNIYTWKFIPFHFTSSFVCFAHSFTAFVKDKSKGSQALLDMDHMNNCNLRGSITVSNFIYSKMFKLVLWSKS